MAKKPILTDDELDGGVPAAPVPPSPAGVTRPLNAPAPSAETRPLDVPPPPPPPPAPETSGRDASGHARPKTRIHGYGSPTRTDLAADTEAGPGTAPEIIPVVGWLVVTGGPGRGAALGLTAGMNGVGRGDDNAVQLDFGDDTISRDAHAYVTYDDEGRRFHLSHGGKTNLVRLNDAPVLAAETLTHGDTMRIGATSLRFVALCGADFDWSDT